MQNFNIREEALILIFQKQEHRNLLYININMANRPSNKLLCHIEKSWKRKMMTFTIWKLFITSINISTYAMLWVFCFVLFIFFSFCHNFFIVGIICSMLYLCVFFVLFQGHFQPSRDTIVAYCTVLCLSHKRHFFFRLKVIYVRSASWM